MNRTASFIVIFIVCTAVAFSSGYWSGTLNLFEGLPNLFERLANSPSDLDTRIKLLESRVSEQLFIPGRRLAGEGIQLLVYNIGNSTVTLSNIQINGYFNSSSPGWIIENDNKILPGEFALVTAYLKTYHLENNLDELVFSFTTENGNTYYCRLPTYGDSSIGIESPQPATGYTKFEQIELPTSYARWDGNKTFTNGGWNVTIELKNTGSADATIDNIFLNGIPLSGYSSSSIRLYEDGQQVPNLSSISISVTKGGSKTLLIQVEKYNATDNSGIEGCTHGTWVDFKIHSASGRDYPTRVKLP